MSAFATSPVPMSAADPQPALRVTRDQVGRRTVLSVTGEVDMASVSELRAAVDSALADGTAELWIDLSRTGFMDSGGLHVLLDARRRLLDLNRRLAVICPGGAVRRLFEVAGVVEWLPVYEDRVAAHLAA
jgi:anti-sigma B factor antagonist